MEAGVALFILFCKSHEEFIFSIPKILIVVSLEILVHIERTFLPWDVRESHLNSRS